MPDGYPSVPQGTPRTETIAVWQHRRMQLAQCHKDISEAIRDMETARAQGVTDAGYATTWAAVLMMADTLKIALSAGDRRARLLFKSLDDAFSRADRFMQHLGYRPAVTRSELMKQLDPNLRRTAEFVGDVRKARAIISKTKLAKPPPHIALMLDLGEKMTEDVLLMMQGMQMQQQVHRQTDAARMRALVHLRAVEAKIRRFDVEATRHFARLDIFLRTA